MFYTQRVGSDLVLEFRTLTQNFANDEYLKPCSMAWGKIGATLGCVMRIWYIIISYIIVYVLSHSVTGLYWPCVEKTDSCFTWDWWLLTRENIFLRQKHSRVNYSVVLIWQIFKSGDTSLIVRMTLTNNDAKTQNIEFNKPIQLE